MFALRKFFAVLFSFFIFMSSASVPSWEVKDSDSVKMTAVFLSDVHIEGNNQDRWTRFGKTMTGVYSTDKAPDALVFAGDQTMNGQWVEWFDFYGLLNRFNRGSRVIMAFGNHEFGNTENEDDYVRLSKRAVACYNGYAGGDVDGVYYAREINGYKFIVMGSENNAPDTVQVISDKQVEWLSNELRDCAGRGMTAFVVNHNLLRGKNGNRSNWDFNLTTNNDAIVSALENSGADIIYVCGHSHFGVNRDTVNTEGKITYVNLPSAGNDGYSASEECSVPGIGMTAECYDGKIVLRFRDFIKGAWLEGYEYEIAV